MARRPDLARDVAVGGLDLDDVGAVVAEDLGGVGTHQHRGQIDDLEAGERSHGRFAPGDALTALSTAPFASRCPGLVTAGRREDQWFPAYGRMRRGEDERYRHCERSEAIHGDSKKEWIASSLRFSQ